jgi:hypothetical protein
MKNISCEQWFSIIDALIPDKFSSRCEWGRTMKHPFTWKRFSCSKKLVEL